MSRFTTARPLQRMHTGLHLFRNRKALWHMIREAMKGQYRMSILTMFAMVLSIAYILFPFDLIPDFIPFLGWIDDGAVLFFLLKRLGAETQRYNRFKAMERKNLP